MNMFFVEQMAMYSAYHRDPRNRATHFIGIPAIALSLLVVLAWLPLGPVNVALVFLAAVLVLYLWLDWGVAIPTIVFYALVYAIAEWIAGLDRTLAWALVIALFVGGWVFQLVGHVFEGRRPALVDNLFQALVAPMFLTAETMFALGLRRDLETEMEARWPKYRFGTGAAAAARQ
jgi:uncharacterized membrane protein YGL010W